MKSEHKKSSRRLPLLLLSIMLISGLLLSACGGFGVQVQSDGQDGLTITGDGDGGGDGGTINVNPDNNSGGDGSTMNTNTVLLVAVGLALLLGILALAVSGSRRQGNPE